VWCGVEQPMRALCGRVSQLLTQPAASLLEAMEALESLLGEEEAPRVVGGHPVLLMGQPATMLAAWGALVDALGEAGASHAVHRDPDLLRPFPNLE
jgi:hypothetical protein